VVAGGNRLHDSGRPRCEETGEQHRRLHLRRGHRELVVDRAELAPLDRDGGVTVGRLDLSTHPPERLGDALHRACRERCVADELEAPMLTRKDARDEPHEGSRVRAIETLGGLGDPSQADAAH
jgi:hypothetical protein